MYKREWTNELKVKARKELNETSKNREECVQHVKEWILEQSHLNTRPACILNFLRGCKFNTERTKEKLEYLYKNKPSIPEFFSNRDPLLPELQEILKRCILVPHSTENEELLIVRWGSTDVNKVSLNNLFKLAFMILDIVFMETSSHLVLGYHIIVDLKGFPLRYCAQLSPSIVKNISYMLLKGYPVRIKGMYIFNTFALFPSLFRMVSLFLNKKVLERVKVFDKFNLEELCNYVNITSIPKEYGGNSDSIYDIGGLWKAHIESYQKWFLENEN